MNTSDLANFKNISPEIQQQMDSLMKELFPICRSITGNGVRQTINKIHNIIDIQTHEIPSGTKVFDWVIPQEWNINDAYVIAPDGKKIVDFNKSNLHVVNYSIPINKKISLNELKKHIHTIPDQPDVIPYVTSYYSREWGFCMTHNEFLNLKDGIYDVFIDSTLHDGSLTYGEFFIPGKSKKEILLSCYVCHPSMCNDNLSGIVLLTFLGKFLQSLTNNYSIRFLFIPETIGAISWLYKNQNTIHNVSHGIVATCLCGDGKLTYKKSRSGNLEIDNTVTSILENSDSDYNIVDFFPWGSDERQFCSPGFNLPIGSLMRNMYNTNDFPQYHTSADDLSFVHMPSFLESLEKYIEVILKLEENFSNDYPIQNKKKKSPNQKYYLNLNPNCEPQLGKRGIYRSFGGQKNSIEHRKTEFAIFWVLNLSDGLHSVSDIVEISGYKESEIQNAINILSEKKLLKLMS